jgi:hypothetical protein
MTMVSLKENELQLLAQMNNQTSTTRTRDAGFVESLLGTYYPEFEGKTDAFCYMDRLVGHDLLVQSLIQVNIPKGKRIEWISDAPKSFKAKRDMITKRSKFKSAPSNRTGSRSCSSKSIENSSARTGSGSKSIAKSQKECFNRR